MSVIFVHTYGDAALEGFEQLVEDMRVNILNNGLGR